MIGLITGTVRGHQLVQTISGVGYVVNCATPLVKGEEVELLVTTIVREDAIILYGFKTDLEQALFGNLIKVTGVGAALAMAILSDLGVKATVAALKSKDAKALSKAKGLGIKRAEILCSSVKLSPELEALDTFDPTLADAPSSTTLQLAAALKGMGFDEKRALEASRVGLEESSELGLALKAALEHLRAENN